MANELRTNIYNSNISLSRHTSGLQSTGGDDQAFVMGGPRGEL